MPEISTIKNLCSRKSGQKFAKIFQQMLLTKIPNYAKLCDHRLKNARDIRDQKFVPPSPPEDVDQS